MLYHTFHCHWLVNNFTHGFLLSAQVHLFKITSMSMMLWIFLGAVYNCRIRLDKVCQCHSLLHSTLYSYSSLLIQWPVCTHELFHSILQQCKWVLLDLFICGTIYCCKENVVAQETLPILDEIMVHSKSLRDFQSNVRDFFFLHRSRPWHDSEEGRTLHATLSNGSMPKGLIHRVWANWVKHLIPTLRSVAHCATLED